MPERNITVTNHLIPVSIELYQAACREFQDSTLASLKTALEQYKSNYGKPEHDNYILGHHIGNTYYKNLNATPRQADIIKLIAQLSAGNNATEIADDDKELLKIEWVNTRTDHARDTKMIAELYRASKTQESIGTYLPILLALPVLFSLYRFWQTKYTCPTLTTTTLTTGQHVLMNTFILYLLIITAVNTTAQRVNFCNYADAICYSTEALRLNCHPIDELFQAEHTPSPTAPETNFFQKEKKDGLRERQPVREESPSHKQEAPKLPVNSPNLKAT